MEALIDLARTEIGYRAKQTKENLYDHEVNPGTHGFSKYFVEMFPNEMRKPYCTAFIQWLFAKRYGYEEGRAVLGIDDYYSTISLFSKALRDNGMIVADPHIGDLILFVKRQWIDHVALITDMDESTFTFISGNVFDSDGVGCVTEEICDRADKTIVLFARPNY